MAELRPVLERLRDQMTPPPGGFEQLAALRRRRRRRERVRAGLLALVLAAAATTLAVRAFGGGDRATIGQTPGGVRNGPIAYVANGEVWTIEADGSAASRIPFDVPGGVGGLSWSPDGVRIAIDVTYYPAEGAPKGGFQDIFVANADGSGAVQLTYDRGDRLPAWSPDGSRIAYTYQDADGGSQIFVMNANGSDAVQLTTGQAFSLRSSWSPDGSRIAFESILDRNSDVYVMNADGGDVTRLTSDPAHDSSPVWSPDGTRIAFTSDRDPSGIYVMNADGTDVSLLEPDDDVANLGIAWSPDGNLLAFSSSRGPGFARAIYTLNLTSGAVTQITDRGPLWGPAWRPIPLGSSPTPTPTGSPAPTISVGEADVFPIQEPPGSVSAVTYGLDSVWVASTDDVGQGWITRLDAVTGEELAEISTGDVFPTWEVGGGGLIVGDGSVWLAGASPAPGEPSGVHAYLLGIDPTTNAVVATIDLQASHPADVAIDGAGVWVMSFGFGESRKMEVSRVDPATDEVVATIPLDSWYGHHLFSVGGWIVAQTNAGAPGEHDAMPEGVLNVIDPETSTEVRTIPVGPSAWPVAGDGALWLATGNVLERIDLSTGQVLASYKVSNTGDALGFGEGGVWFIDPEGRNVVRRFNPSLGTVDLSVVLPSDVTPIAMTTSPGSLWVLDYHGSLVHVDLR
jgi:Tol biopolymer transport system component